MAAQVREVIDTFCTAAEMGPESLSGYVISMATNPSDVLAVELLKREAAFLVSRLPATAPASVRRGSQLCTVCGTARKTPARVWD